MSESDHRANRRLQIKASIETRAVKALAKWKATFADEVTQQAKLIASQGDTPELVTLLDYQLAAPVVLQSLIAAIAIEQATDAYEKVA